MCNRSDIHRFAEEARAIGVEYVGLCCGNAANFMRELAEVYGRKPAASKYSPNLQNNIIFGEAGKKGNKENDKIRKFSVGEYSANDLTKLRMGGASKTTALDDHAEAPEHAWQILPIADCTEQLFSLLNVKWLPVMHYPHRELLNFSQDYWKLCYKICY